MPRGMCDGCHYPRYSLPGGETASGQYCSAIVRGFVGIDCGLLKTESVSPYFKRRKRKEREERMVYRCRR